MSGSLRALKGSFRDLVGRFRFGSMDRDVTVLMFHEVGEQRDYGPGFYSVSQGDFERIISEFSETHEFLSLEEIVSWLNGEKDLPEEAVAVTFDDGYLSTLEKALPVLEKFDVPATVYVPTGFLDIDYSCGWRLKKYIEENDSVELEIGGRTYSYELGTSKDEERAYEEIKEALRSRSILERKEVMAKLKAGEQGSGRLMREEELKELDESGLISIGAHGTDHRRLTDLEPEEARESIFESKRRLEEVLGHEVLSFSFPFGAKNRRLVNMVEEAGFDKAVITEGRKISERDWACVYRIPRVEGKDF